MKLLVEAWNASAPSRHSHYDNLNQAWQQALQRFASRLMRW